MDSKTLNLWEARSNISRIIMLNLQHQVRTAAAACLNKAVLGVGMQSVRVAVAQSQPQFCNDAVYLGLAHHQPAA